MLINNDKSVSVPCTFRGTWPLVDWLCAVRQVLFALFPVAGLLVIPGSPKNSKDAFSLGQNKTWKLVKPKHDGDRYNNSLIHQGSLEFGSPHLVSQGSMSVSLLPGFLHNSVLKFP